MRSQFLTWLLGVFLVSALSCKGTPAIVANLPDSADDAGKIGGSADTEDVLVSLVDVQGPGVDQSEIDVDVGPTPPDEDLLDSDPADLVGLDDADSTDGMVPDEPDAPAVPDAADGYAVVTPTGLCNDGLQLPYPGESCGSEGSSTCTRVGEAETGYSQPNGTVVKLCERANRLVCIKSESGALKWQISPCPKASKACGGWGHDWACTTDGSVSSCCPPAAMPQPTPGEYNPGAASYCTADQQGQRQCGPGGHLYECATFAAIKQKTTFITPAAFDKALGACMSPDPKCFAYFLIDPCKILNWKACAKYPFKDINYSSDGTWCTDNYEGTGVKCIDTCEDLKKYCKTCTPWPGQ
jgi:hypothetical protein